MYQTKSSAYDQLKDLTSVDLKRVDDIILQLAESHVDIIPEITNYFMNAGGKRIRPILTLACGKLLGLNDSEKLVKLAAAVELIHTATLFHDDVIDNSDLRRGQKTANNVWSNKVCILVGDFLLSHAFKLMVDCGSLEALDMLSQTSILLTESEIWQLDILGNTDLTVENYIALIKGKTAQLFSTSCAVSSFLDEKHKNLTAPLYEFGMNLGILYQIVDDILDYKAIDPKFGKTIGNDCLEKKVTLPLIILLQSASAEDKLTIINTFNAPSPDVNIISGFLHTYDCFTKCNEICNMYAEKTYAVLDSLPQNTTNTTLRELISFLINRCY